ncbi:MAG: hypothetical protein WBM86_02430 [Waterburya sp.]
MRELYIFVTTDRPDQYLNSIVHCIEEGTKKIVFVQVENNSIEQVQLNILKNNVYDLLHNLSEGCYKYYTGKHKGLLVKLNDKYSNDELTNLKVKYSRCLKDDIDWTKDRVSYLNLRSYISTLSKNKNVFFDVTAISKIYIGDIFACSLVEDINNLCTFELLVKPNFDEPWKTLIHDLAVKKLYKYINLVETPIFKNSRKSILIRTTPLFISILGTLLFIGIAITATFFFGFSSVFIQSISTIAAVLGIISFFLIYFPIRSK